MPYPHRDGGARVAQFEGDYRDDITAIVLHLPRVVAELGVAKHDDDEEVATPILRAMCRRARPSKQALESNTREGAEAWFGWLAAPADRERRRAMHPFVLYYDLRRHGWAIRAGLSCWRGRGPPQGGHAWAHISGERNTSSS